VQNWNEGKSQEFLDRKTYNIGASVLTHQGPVSEEHHHLGRCVVKDHVLAAEAALSDIPAAKAARPDTGAASSTGIAPAAPAAGRAGLRETPLLFTTATCPNCKLACALLDKAGVKYEKLIANDHPDLVAKYGVKQAPTLVVLDGAAPVNFRGVSDIKQYLMSLAAAAVA
jgi:ribonucleoside-triphosphate reductase